MKEAADTKAIETKCSGMQRDRLSRGDAASAAGPQILSCAVLGGKGRNYKACRLRLPYVRVLACEKYFAFAPFCLFTPAERIDVCCQLEVRDRSMSEFEGKAENICSHRAFPVLTQL